MTNNRQLDDARLVEVLQGGLREIISVLDDATPEALDRLRRGDWSLRLSPSTALASSDGLRMMSPPRERSSQTRPNAT